MPRRALTDRDRAVLDFEREWTGQRGGKGRAITASFGISISEPSFRGQGYGARMTAGYCWRWSDPRPDGTLQQDAARSLCKYVTDDH